MAPNLKKMLESLKRSSKNTDRFMVVEISYWVSRSEPEHACSPDGLVMDLDEPSIYGILERECPNTLENECISVFENKAFKSTENNVFPRN